MNNNFLKTKLIPVFATIIIFILWWVPLGLDFFETILGMVVVLIASYMEYRKKLFTSLGFSTFKFKDFFVAAPIIAGVLFIIYYFILVPFITALTNQPIDISQFDELQGNIYYSLVMLIFIWISAGFGEEIIWRGYFMRQLIKFFGDSKLSIVINILLCGVVFGFLHGYQGITGQIITGIIGMILATIFYIKKYNLWLNIAIHGFFDTIALIIIYNGWY